MRRKLFWLQVPVLIASVIYFGAALVAYAKPMAKPSREELLIQCADPFIQKVDGVSCDKYRAKMPECKDNEAPLLANGVWKCSKTILSGGNAINIGTLDHVFKCPHGHTYKAGGHFFVGSEPTGGPVSVCVRCLVEWVKRNEFTATEVTQ